MILNYPPVGSTREKCTEPEAIRNLSHLPDGTFPHSKEHASYGCHYLYKQSNLLLPGESNRGRDTYGNPAQTELPLKKKRISKAFRRGFISVGSVLLFPEISRTTSSDYRGQIELNS
jgi:hypothetical protein